MHLAGATQLLAAVAFFAKIVSASPIAWPDDKLEAINVLRARGASEVSTIVDSIVQEFCVLDCNANDWSHFNQPPDHFYTGNHIMLWSI